MSDKVTTYHLKVSHKSCQKLLLVNNSNMYNSATVPEEWSRDPFRNSVLLPCMFPYITHRALTGRVLIITNEPSDRSHVFDRCMGCLTWVIKDRMAPAWQWDWLSSWWRNPWHMLACTTAATRKAWRPSLRNSEYAAGQRLQRAPYSWPLSWGLRPFC